MVRPFLPRPKCKVCGQTCKRLGQEHCSRICAPKPRVLNAGLVRGGVKTQIGPFCVSTVLVPSSTYHGLYPDRYETAVFDHRKRTDMTHNDEVLFSVYDCTEVENYGTEDLAKAGHEKWVERVKIIESLNELEGEWR
jgi:hypothetical protein